MKSVFRQTLLWLKLNLLVESREVHIDLKEDNVLVSVDGVIADHMSDVITDHNSNETADYGSGPGGGWVLVMLRTVIVVMMSLISYYSDDCDEEVLYWLFLARDRESPLEPKAVRYSTRSTRGVYHDPFRGVYHDPGEVRQTFCSVSEMVDVSIE